MGNNVLTPPTGSRSSSCSAACVHFTKCSALLHGENCVLRWGYLSDYLESNCEMSSSSLAMCCAYVTNKSWTTARSPFVTPNANGPPGDFLELAGQFSKAFVVLRILFTLPIHRVHLLGTSDRALGSEHPNLCPAARAINRLRVRFLQRSPSTK